MKYDQLAFSGEQTQQEIDFYITIIYFYLQTIIIIFPKITYCDQIKEHFIFLRAFCYSIVYFFYFFLDKLFYSKSGVGLSG